MKIRIRDFVMGVSVAIIIVLFSSGGGRRSRGSLFSHFTDGDVPLWQVFMMIGLAVFTGIVATLKMKEDNSKKKR